MIDTKTSKQIKTMQEGGKILAEILDKLAKASKPGINTLKIESLAEELINKYNANPSFKGYLGYKYATCISVNSEVVHGIPGRHNLKPGDIVSIDCGVCFKGFHTDSAVTIGVGKISNKAKKLINTTKYALEESIKLIEPGIRLGVIQAKIQEIAERNSYCIIKDLSGHGIGRNLQEDPQIPNYGKSNQGIILKTGMTICLEPMLSLGSENIKIENDGWTISTLDNSLSAHFEHTIAVTQKSHLCLTSIDL